jgi:hypothetical protein
MLLMLGMIRNDRRWRRGGCAEQIPQQNNTVISTTSQHAALGI